MDKEVIEALEEGGFEIVDLTPKSSERDGPIWECKIGLKEGTVVEMPGGSDFPMRMAVEKAFKEITGLECDFNFSGWGAELTELEKAVING